MSPTVYQIVCVRAYVRAWMRSFVRAAVRSCVRACARACARVHSNCHSFLLSVQVLSFSQLYQIERFSVQCFSVDRLPFP